MRPPALYFLSLLTLAVSLAGAGCSKSNSSGDPFSIISKTPGPGAKEVSVNTTVRVQFSQEVDTFTLPGNFTLRQQSGAEVPGTLFYEGDSGTAVFVPTYSLAIKTTYEVTVRSAVRGVSGRSLDNTYVWTFTTQSLFQWQRQLSGTAQPLLSVFFISDRVGWVAGWGGVRKTNDGGSSWEGQSVPVTPNYHSIFLRDLNHGWVVGTVALVLKTTDGGSNWQGVPSPPVPSADLYGVCFADLDLGWTVGFDGRIFHSKDGGDNWTLQLSPTTAALYGVYFVTTAVGWAVGANGTVLHTKDGGVNWQVQNSNTLSHLRGVHFVNQSVGWTVGEFGTILKTTDGGAQWNFQNSGTANRLNAVAFVNTDTGWAVGVNGFITHSQNGGNTWVGQSSGTNKALTGLSFVSPSLGWAVGDEGVVLKGSQ